MSLLNYTDILTGAANWLARDDITFLVPDFIRIVEARLNRELRVREMITELSASTSQEYFGLPTDFVEVYSFRIDSSPPVTLEYRPVEEIEASPVETGIPRFFSVVGGSLRLYPAPDASYGYTFLYYATIPPLTETDDTNWLFDKAPDAYLFGSIAEGAKFLMDDARSAYWEDQFQKVIRSLRTADARSGRTNGPRRMRVLV